LNGWNACGSVKAIKLWLDVFYTLPPVSIQGLSFLFWSQYMRCIILLKRLSTYEDPAWDRQAVRNVVDLPHVLQWMIDKLELASREAGERADDDLFRHFSRIMRMSRA
jgi:hypothetical protein